MRDAGDEVGLELVEHKLSAQRAQCLPKANRSRDDRQRHETANHPDPLLVLAIHQLWRSKLCVQRNDGARTATGMGCVEDEVFPGKNGRFGS